MHIGIYSPYLDTAGGGEKYILTIAEFLSEKENVDFLLGTHLYNIDVDDVKKRINFLHGLKLTKVNFIKAPIGLDSSFLSRLYFFRKYDLLFYLTDGSIFYSTAKKNIIHFQVPFENTERRSLWGKIKMSSWKLAIYNSKFTKDIVNKSWPISGEVIYPPVSIGEFKPLKKKKQIISVGRFANNKSKKQLVLIKAFNTLNEDGWSLHLAGGFMEGDRDYINELKDLARGTKVYFYENASIAQLKKLYGEGSIYWHATGFEETDPKKMEHFGITTVEAMAAGCVPIVINLGGQPEIVENGVSGFLWNNLDELLSQTKKVITDRTLFNRLSKNAIQRSKMFSKESFCKHIKKIIYE